MAASDAEHVAPVYITASSLPAAEEKQYSVNELCSAAEKTAGFRSMEGAQRIGGLWRLYPTNIDARVAVLTKGIVLRGVCITPRDKNPFIVTDDRGNERETPATKLTIGNVPMSFSNMEIMNAVQSLGVKIRSSLIEERDRDPSGKLTRWKTGRRFLYMEVPAKPLPKTLRIGICTASLYHKEQRVPTCSNCLSKGHHASACEAPTKCKQCFADHHKAGDKVCPLTPKHAPSPIPDQSPPPPPPQAKPPSSPISLSSEPRREKAAKQTTLSFQSQRHRSRSHTPTPGKRQRERSVSTQRSPASQQSKKNARTESEARNTANRQETRNMESEDSDLEDFHDT